MSETLQAIETIWAGYRFRSRLEARWAVFFNAIGLDYQYENEGFHVEGYDGEEDIYYLPDFYFPKQQVYAEVKGSKELLQKDAIKIGTCIDFNATPISKGLIILGEIPFYEQISWGNIPMFSYLFCDSGVIEENAIFTGDKFRPIVTKNNEILHYIFSYHHDNGPDCRIPYDTETKCKWTNLSRLSFSEKHFDNLRESYRKARQARFEHGEAPEVINW